MSASENTNTSVINMEKCKVVLLDVAGTTTSINFVKETLLPYAVKQAEEFLKSNWEEEAVKTAVKSLQDISDELDLKKATDLFKELTEKNDENAALKTLQGLIYKKGYEDGELKAHVFEDVPSALELWSKSRQVAIFSTGSLDSQKLLFKHTTGGDLSAHLNNYFDQSIGSKLQSDSYEKIAEKMNCKPEEIVFITDNADEAKAAKTAKFEVAIIKREGNAEIPEDTLKEYTVLSSFKDVTAENSSKRKVEEETAAAEVPPAKIAKTESTDKDEVKAEDKKMEEEEAKNGDSEEKMEVDSAEKPKEECVTEEAKTKEPETESKDSKTTDKTEEKTESVPVEEKKSAEEEVKPAAEEKSEDKVPVEEKAAETVKEDCVDSKAKETTEEKTEESKKETEKAPEPESKSEEAEKAEPEKVEVEKENKSEIANGVASTNAEEKNGVSDKTNGDKKDDALEKKPEETEIKVKKIEETPETTTTSAEVSVEA